MNRCKIVLHTLYLIAAGLLFTGTLAAFSPEAAAQTLVREFPKAALRGELRVLTPPDVVLNGNPARLSPGARIRNTNNLVVMSGALAGQFLLVNYVRDSSGLLHEVWIVTPEEAALKRPGLETKFNFNFASDADKPKVDDGKIPFNQLPKYPK